MGRNGIDTGKIIEIITGKIREEGVGFFAQLDAFLTGKLELSRGDSKALTEKIMEQFKEKAFPPVTRLEMFLTENCPLRCDYCFVEGKNNYKRMSRETAMKAVDFLIRESADKEDVNIIFFGGEPLLEFELMKEITEYSGSEAKKAGKKITYDITTNGVLFTDEILKYFHQKGIKFLLSIDGDAETHNRHRKTVDGKGSYELVMEKFPMMKKYQPWMGAKLTVHPDTAHKITDNVIHLSKRGFNQFIIGAASGVEWDEENWKIYEEQMHEVARIYRKMKKERQYFRMTLFEEEEDKFFNKKYIWGCQAGRHSLTIAANGDIYPCAKMLGLDDLGGICRLGDLDSGITEIITRGELMGMGKVDRSKCGECEILDCCKGGCFATNYLETKNMFKPSFFDCRTSAIQTRVITSHLRALKEESEDK